jgi:hypothetical protein
MVFWETKSLICRTIGIVGKFVCRNNLKKVKNKTPAKSENSQITTLKRLCSIATSSASCGVSGQRFLQFDGPVHLTQQFLRRGN